MYKCTFRGIYGFGALYLGHWDFHFVQDCLIPVEEFLTQGLWSFLTWLPVHRYHYTIDLTHKLPKTSYVVPFWFCYGFLVRDRNLLPKKGTHRGVWVGLTSRVSVGFLVCHDQMRTVRALKLPPGEQNNQSQLPQHLRPVLIVIIGVP